MAGKLLTTKIDDPSEEAVSAASSTVSSGGVVVYPSDTVYGLLADGFSGSALNRLLHLKGYSSPRPFILLVPSVKRAMSLVAVESCREHMERYWPGPVTLVVPASNRVPVSMVGPTGGVALRFPRDPLSRRILERTGLVTASTNANSAGEEAPLSIDQVNRSILNGADTVIDGGNLGDRAPSMVLDLTGDEPVRVR